MPEIAEVETVRNTLKKMILHKKIKSVNIIYPRILESDIKEFEKIMVGREFVDIDRIGKWLMFDLSDYYLLSHLRMEGKFFVKNSNEKIEKHEHLIITFEDNSELRYHDTRKFGRMNLVKKEEINNVEAIKKQGIEPISKDLTKEYLFSKFKDKNVPIKTLLLDQTIISGLGNIYANEVLFASGIYPERKGKDITIGECEKIVKSCNSIIKEAIKEGGTTIKSYTSSLGVTGRFQQFLKVHKKEGELCDICKKPIEKIKIGGRSTYYCPKCQKH